MLIKKLPPRSADTPPYRSQTFEGGELFREDKQDAPTYETSSQK